MSEILVLYNDCPLLTVNYCLAAESFAPWQDHVISSKRRAAKSPFGPLRLYPSATSEHTVTVTFSSRYVVIFQCFCGTLKRSFKNIPSLSLHKSSPSKQVEAWHRSGGRVRSPHRCPAPPVAGCTFSHERQLCIWGNLVSLPLFVTVQSCQYEMILDEASPEPAAFICRFPEELDRRMWGSR